MKPVIIPLSLSNTYLLPCQEGYLQIDTGYDRDYLAYRKGLDRAGIPLESIKFVLLTHHHDDHAGFLNGLARVTTFTIIAHQLGQDLLRSGKNDKSRGGGYVNRLIRQIADIKMALDPHWTLAFPPFELRPYDILISGDNDQVLPGIGIPGRILYTPGHCIDHQVVILDDGDVFCGDAASSFPPWWIGTHYATLFMTDMDEAYRSWHKMLDAGARTIYPAHGKPFPAGRLQQHMGRIHNDQLVKFF